MPFDERKTWLPRSSLKRHRRANSALLRRILRTAPLLRVRDIHSAKCAKTWLWAVPRHRLAGASSLSTGRTRWLRWYPAGIYLPRQSRAFYPILDTRLSPRAGLASVNLSLRGSASEGGARFSSPQQRTSGAGISMTPARSRYVPPRVPCSCERPGDTPSCGRCPALARKI